MLVIRRILVEVRNAGVWFNCQSVFYNVQLLILQVFFLIVSICFQQGKTEEQITAEKAWYNTDKVWLVHKDGFSLGESNFVISLSRLFLGDFSVEMGFGGF